MPKKKTVKKAADKSPRKVALNKKFRIICLEFLVCIEFVKKFNLHLKIRPLPRDWFHMYIYTLTDQMKSLTTQGRSMIFNNTKHY